NPAILGLPLPDGFSFFGIKDTSIVYRFYENNHVGSLLEVSFSVQDGEPTFIETSVNSDILNSAFNYTSDTESPWTIFPNPTFSNDITMAALKPNHDIVIHISDIKGRLIHTQEIANCNGSEVISVPNLSGLYTIKILDKTDKTLSSKKFLKL
ncbi:MAG: T9SS type A sorting domain-containing protein, partial [Saprospiraceae bacterium]|nr:T9SS type A sorting domain-containing protein [Saprospiraceae bacterium]